MSGVRDEVGAVPSPPLPSYPLSSSLFSSCPSYLLYYTITIPILWRRTLPQSPDGKSAGTSSRINARARFNEGARGVGLHLKTTKVLCHVDQAVGLLGDCLYRAPTTAWHRSRSTLLSITSFSPVLTCAQRRVQWGVAGSKSTNGHQVGVDATLPGLRCHRKKVSRGLFTFMSFGRILRELVIWTKARTTVPSRASLLMVMLDRSHALCPLPKRRKCLAVLFLNKSNQTNHLYSFLFLIAFTKG